MTGYIVQRIVQAVFLLFLLSIMFFMLVHTQPSGPCSAARNAGCFQIQHLDQPIANQYAWWLGQMLHGNFGLTTSGEPVARQIAQDLPPTIILIGVAVVIQQLIAIPLGMLAAIRPYSIFDQALTFGSYTALSIPSFLLGTLLLYVVAGHWHVLPVGRNEDAALPLLLSHDWWIALLHQPALILGDLAKHLFLPVVVLIVTGIAMDSRYMRAAMLQVLGQDYIRTARAKGANRRLVIFKHAFRNALLPVLTNFALYLPTLIGGVVVVEQVFSWGGIGFDFATAAGRGAFAIYNSQGSDFAFLEAVLMLSAVVVLAVNLLTDLAYVWLDPRIRFDRGDSG